MSSITIILIGMGTEGTSIGCIDNLINTTTIPPPAVPELMFFNKSLTAFIEHQVIIPQMRFNCSGIIRSWSGVAVLARKFIENMDIFHAITFTVWRPRTIEGSSLSEYSIVGHSLLRFNSRELNGSILEIDDSTGIVSEEFAFFHFIEKMAKPREQIAFQPGDVVGWNVGPRFRTISPPLSIAYRNATTGELGVDIISTSSSSEETVCSISECTDDVAIQRAVIPYLSFQYGKSIASYICSR